MLSNWKTPSCAAHSKRWVIKCLTLKSSESFWHNKFVYIRFSRTLIHFFQELLTFAKIFEISKFFSDTQEQSTATISHSCASSAKIVSLPFAGHRRFVTALRVLSAQLIPCFNFAGLQEEKNYLFSLNNCLRIPEGGWIYLASSSYHPFLEFFGKNLFSF